MILINPCRARGVPREPRSQEGLLDERLTSTWRSVVAFLSSLFRPRAHMDRFLSAPATLQKSIHFEHFQKSTKMVSQSDLFGSWPLLVPQKVKIDPNMGPKSDIFGPQNGHNATCCQSSSKHKLYYNSPDILLYLILNKL